MEAETGMGTETGAMGAETGMDTSLESTEDASSQEDLYS
jgi:hypothetical protein